MNADHMKVLRKRLLAMKSRLDPEVADLKREALQPTAAQASLGMDAQSDPGASAAEEEVARSLFDAESGTLAEVDAALARMDRGSYGTCGGCGAAIAQARLETIPYARDCIRCAKRAES